MSIIEINGFGKDFGEFTAVQSLDLRIEEGELYGFIGPNGAGKSTTIRFLATLLRPLAAMVRSTDTASPKRPWMSAEVSVTCPMRLACTTA